MPLDQERGCTSGPRMHNHNATTHTHSALDHESPTCTSNEQTSKPRKARGYMAIAMTGAAPTKPVMSQQRGGRGATAHSSLQNSVGEGASQHPLLELHVPSYFKCAVRADHANFSTNHTNLCCITKSQRRFRGQSLNDRHWTIYTLPHWRAHAGTGSERYLRKTCRPTDLAS